MLVGGYLRVLGPVGGVAVLCRQVACAYMVDGHEMVTAEINAAREVCQAVVRTLLEQRLLLLHSGWLSTNPLCEALDQDAAKWAMQQEAQRRQLLALLRADAEG